MDFSTAAAMTNYDDYTTLRPELRRMYDRTVEIFGPNRSGEDAQLLKAFERQLVLTERWMSYFEAAAISRAR